MATYASVNDVINTIIAIEKAEDGYLEKASNSNLDSKTANAGYNNYTKYWRDLNQLGLMGQSSNFSGGPAWAWCAGFQSWAFIKAVGVELARKLLLHLPFTTCAVLGDKSKANGQLFSDPKVGDVVLFHNGSRHNHTGYVYAVDSSKFYTIEGNTNASSGVVPNGGGVHLKSYVRSTMKAKGTKFHRPNYALAVNASAPSNTTTTKPSAPAATTKPNTSTSANGVKATIATKTDPLNCRKSPSDDSAILGKFSKGATVTVVEKTNSSWWKVKGSATNGKTITGYCSTKYLTKKATSTSNTTKATIATKSDPLRCRSTASSNGKILGKFSKGATVTVVEKTNNSWWKVKGVDTTGKTITGYCSRTYLK